MMNLLVLTVSFTLAILLSGVIFTVAMFALMGNGRVIKWLMEYYMKQIEKSMKYFEDVNEG